MVYKVGFTGTNKGMAPEQKEKVRELLTLIKSQHPDDTCELHHGLCIGADEQAAIIAKELGYRVVSHPGNSPRNPNGTQYRSDWTGSDETREVKFFIDRDKDIVNEVSEMLAAPLTREERTRSGTWTTVRYARTQNRPLSMVLPALPKITPAPAPPPPRTNAISGQDPHTPDYWKRGVR
jgi:hypothetical protein